MGYLIVEMIVLLLIAAVIGFLIGWFLRRSGRVAASMDSDLKPKLETAEARAANLTKEIEEDQAEIGRLREQLEATRREVNEEREKFGALEGEVGSVREKEAALATALNDVSNRDAEIERLKSQLSSAQEGAGADGGAAGELQANLDRVQAELDSLRTQHADCVSNSDAQKARIAELEAQLAASSQADASAPVEAAAAPAAPTESPAEAPPKPDWLLDAPDGEADDLKRIKGVGPVMERTLNELGIYHFRQVAKLDDAGIEWVSANIATFPDRIRRDEWAKQAHDLHVEKYGSAP